MQSIQGKLIIITGTNKGIGLATINSLLNRGAIVAGWGRSNTVTHSNYKFFKCDVRFEDQIKTALQETISHFKMPIFGLINNAGLGKFASLEEITNENWHLMFDTNVHGTMYCCKAVAPIMKNEFAGHIINIVSIAGLEGIKNASGYCATKFAVKGFSHSIYKELREFGVKVTCIYPGSVNTHFFDEIESVTASENMMSPNDISELILTLLETDPNLLPVDLEIRPLMPQGKPAKK